MSAALPCPFCGKAPDVDRVEPWPAYHGPAPWSVGHYGLQPVEHYVGANGDTQDAAIADYNRQVRQINALSNSGGK